jgi:hypothetical protein
MAARNWVISIQFDLEARADGVVVVTFNRVHVGGAFSSATFSNRSYPLVSEASEMCLNDLISRPAALIYDAVASRSGRLQLNVDVSQVMRRGIANR